MLARAAQNRAAALEKLAAKHEAQWNPATISVEEAAHWQRDDVKRRKAASGAYVLMDMYTLSQEEKQKQAEQAQAAVEAREALPSNVLPATLPALQVGGHLVWQCCACLEIRVV